MYHVVTITYYTGNAVSNRFVRYHWRESSVLYSKLQANIRTVQLGTVVVSVAQLVARRTNNRKVVGSMPANVLCITVDR